MTSPEAVKCHFCRAPVERVVVDLGCVPLANSYLAPDELGREEPRYPLCVRVCERCLLVQVQSVVPPDAIFGDYAYFSSYSDSWVEHARRFADTARGRLGLGAGSLVLEVASNDGYLLRHFLAAGVPVLGVEPAANVAAVAADAGIPTEVEFFGADTARHLVGQGRRADLLVANNVLAHVPDPGDFVAGMAIALRPDGVISIEVPHVLRLLADVQFDTIYHEHFSYFSLLTVETILKAHGLSVFDVDQLPTHGGSLRIWAGHDRAGRDPSRSLLELRQAEREAGLDRVDAYSGFSEKVERCRRSVVDFLAQARREGKSVVGYGAAAKGNTLLNFCRIGTDDMAYVVDRSPHKQGRFLPGSRLPIEPPSRVAETRPDFVFILPWNLRDEIMEQMAHVRQWGGSFVTPVPEIAVHP